MNLCDERVIRAVLARHGFHFSKSLGQNFLREASVPQGIAEGAGLDENTCVLEVGPGLGCLTRELCVRAKKVVAVELDARLPAVLADTLSDMANFTLVQGDILKVDLPALTHEHFGASRAVACANLPYYITTPAITTLIESGCFAAITVMVQREVADRICAAPGSRDYSAFTVYINYHAQARKLLDVPRDCFIPAPNVDSAVVRLDLLAQPPVPIIDKAMFFRVVKAAFAQRRKTMRNCMNAAFGDKLTKEQMENCMIYAGIDPSARGETLSISQFAKLAEQFLV